MRTMDLKARLGELPPLLTVMEAGELLGVGRTAAYDAAQRGDLPVLRWGRRIYVSTARLLSMIGLDDEDDG